MGLFRGSPLFLAVSGLCHFISISILNFGSFSTKLGGNVLAIQKMTQNDYGPGPGWKYGKNGHFYVWPKSVFFWPKIRFIPKNTQKKFKD